MARFQRTKPLTVPGKGRASADPPARQPQSAVIKNGNESIQILDTGPIEEVEIRNIASRDGGETAPAVDFDDLEEQKNIGPKVHRYTVIRGGRVQTQVNGPRTVIQVGKPIDDLNFDIQLMKRQGIQLEEVTDLEATG